jgi:RNA polymerase sigma-70 factor, ECF subfamily
MQEKGKEIPIPAEWVINTVMDNSREIVAEEGMVTSTGKVAGIRIHRPLHPKNPATKTGKHAFNEKPEYSLFSGVFWLFFFSPKHQRMTETELINGIINQNNKAIQDLVKNYQKKVIKTAYYFVANMEDAEDLSQEVFLEILKSIDRYKKNASLSTWIYRITVNKSLDHLRRQKRRNILQTVGSVLKISFDGTNSEENKLAAMDTRNEDKEKREILDSAVNSLHESQKIAFILNKYEELSYKEIAEVMNLSLSSVESLIHRAKLNLQKKLVNYFSEYAQNNR